MKRIGSTSLTISASLGLLTAALACSSGTTDPEAAGKGGSGSGATGATDASGGSTGATGGSAGATGGSAGTSSGASVCDGATTPLLADQTYIDNFETDVRWAGWYAFSDTTPPNTAPVREGDAGEGALGTGTAIHVAASAIKTPTSTPEAGYGAGVGFNLIDPALEKCKDVSAFDGISFWIKGTSGTSNMVTFQVVHPATAPVADGGDCTVMAQCYLHPKKAFAVTGEWTQVSIGWDELAGSTAMVTGPILGFNIITPDDAWDVYIDEVQFYSGTAPTGPVTPPDDGGGAAGAGAGGAGG